MAKISKEELLTQVSAYAGERNDDATISLIENITDSFPDGEDWKSKYEENDKMWREKYISRFKNFTENQDNTIQPDPPEDDITVEELDEAEDAYEYDDLFEEVE